MCSATLGAQGVSALQTSGPWGLQERNTEQLLNATKAGMGQARPQAGSHRGGTGSGAQPPHSPGPQMCLACEARAAFVLCGHTRAVGHPNNDISHSAGMKNTTYVH